MIVVLPPTLEVLNLVGGPPLNEIDRAMDIMPFVIESDGRRERAYDIYSLLLKERIVFLGTPIDAMIANIIIAQLLYLAREDDEKDIMMYINCPGGSVTAGLAIYDTMNLIRPKVSTVCIGLAVSSTVPMLAASPMHTVETLGRIRFIVS